MPPASPDPEPEPSLDDLVDLFTAQGRTWIERGTRWTQSEVEAEDALQDALLTALEAPHLMGTIESLGGWLFTVIKRRCIDLVRRDSRGRALLENWSLEAAGLDPEASEPESELLRAELLDSVTQAIEALPSEQRELVIANEIHGLTFAELSRELKVPAGTLMARKKKGMDAVRAHLRRQERLDASAGSRPHRQDGAQQ